MIQESLQAQGRWDLRLRPETPPSVIEALGYWGHVVITPQVLDPRRHSDAELLTAARYAGIVWRRRMGPDEEQTEIGGPGLVAHLGDADQKGDVYETELSFEAATFANTIRGLLPAGGAIREGTLHSVAGTYTGAHRLETPRQAIAYVCGVFGAEYRIRPSGLLDAGLASQLYVTTPQAILVRRGGGADPVLRGVPVAALEAEQDTDDYTTRLLLLGQGTGETLVLGSASAQSVPYKDLFGGTLVRKRMVSEAETSEGNATARAQLHLNRFSGLRDGHRISTDDFDVEGSFSLGDQVWVYDPPSELVDTTKEVRFRGRVLHPRSIRVVGWTWPVRRGSGVLYRAGDGSYLDLTPWVEYETGGVDLDVGASPRPLSEEVGAQLVSGRVNTDPDGNDLTIPAVPAKVLPWQTFSYQDAEGRTRAGIIVEWSQPLNTDGSAVLDGSHYQVRWRRNA